MYFIFEVSTKWLNTFIKFTKQFSQASEEKVGSKYIWHTKYQHIITNRPV